MESRSKIGAFTDLIIRFRWLVLLGLVLFSGGMGYLGAGLSTNNSYDTWLPQKDRVKVLYDETDREFSSNAPIFFVLEFSEKGVFHPESLAHIRRITDLLESVPELFYVMSLTNIVDIRAAEDGVVVGDLIDEIPEDPEELQRLEDYVLSKEMYVNAVVSEDARFTVILMNIDAENDEVEVAGRVLDLIDENTKDISTYYGGDPAIAHYTNLYMERDMELLIPLMFLVMMVILGFGLRRFWGVVLPLVTVFLTIFWTLGFQRVLNMPMNLLSPAVLVMLIAMGSDYAVHAFNHYLRTGDTRRAGAEITTPIILSAITTIAGLLTFATTGIEILNHFGYELAIGLGSACVLSITFLIALLRILRPKPEVRAEAGEKSAAKNLDEGHIFSRFLEGLTLRVLKYRRSVLAGVVVLLLAMGVGIFRIDTNVDFVTFLPEESPPRIGHEILRDNFGGIYPVSLYLRGDMEDPALLTLQLRMENYLRGNQLLSGFTSVASMVAEMNRLLTGVYAIPDSRAGVASLWLLMESEPYLKALVNEERDKALGTAMIRESATDVIKAMAGFVDKEIPVGGKDEILILDPALLPPGERERLLEICMKDAAGQLAALVKGYSSGGGTATASAFMKTIQETMPEIRNLSWDDDIEAGLRDYLRNEAIQALDRPVEDEVIEAVRTSLPLKDVSEDWSQRLRSLLVRQGGVDPEDAVIIEEGVLWHYRELLRAGKVEHLGQALYSGLPESLRKNSDFSRRADGVLWELLGDRPGVLQSDCSHMSGIEAAVVRKVPVELDQTGAPSMFRKFDELLLQSQLQSLFLASLVVFLLVAVTQGSLKRGIISIVAVLAPLEIVIGLMGWMGIPLDFGTALFGALIIGLGIDGCIHILHYEVHLRGQGLTEEQSLVRTFRHVGRAVLTANVTTGGGFLMLMFSSTSAIRNFSIVNVLAISFVTVSLLTLLPVLIKISHVFGEAPGKGVALNRFRGGHN